MKLLALSVALVVIGLPASQVADKALPDKLIDVTIQHIKTSGPDSDVAQLVSMMGPAAWSRRAEFVELVAPYLEDKNPNKVAGAIEVLYRFRHYRPMHEIGGNFEKDNAVFFAKLDRSVDAHLAHFRRYKEPKVFHNLALYLGVSRSKEAKRELLWIAKETPAKEQALICLAWHRAPEDMEDLLPFLLENSRESRVLPYHFRNSYGVAAIPYLKRAIAEAESADTRRAAEKELQLLQKRE